MEVPTRMVSLSKRWLCGESGKTIELVLKSVCWWNLIHWIRMLHPSIDDPEMS
jgi:hypothetical protein